MSHHLADGELAKRVARAEFATRLFILLLVALLIAAVVTILQVRNTQIEGTPTGRKLVASADRILDCTDPGTDGGQAGKCYRENQRKTAQILQDVSRVIIISAACSAGTSVLLPLSQRIAVISACVTDALAAPNP